MFWMNVAGKILPVFIFIGIGVLLKRGNFLAEKTVSELKKFVVNFALPALLFTTFLNTGFRASHGWIIAAVFLVNMLTLAIGKGFGHLLARDNPYFPLLFTGFEMGMLGFSLFGVAYGTEGLGAIGIIDLGQEIFVWFVLATILTGLRDGTSGAGKIVISFVTSPVIIGIAWGIALNLTGVRDLIGTNAVAGGVLATVTMLSQITVPLILIIIGYQMNLEWGKVVLPAVSVLLRIPVMLAAAFAIDMVLFRHMLGLPRIFSIALYTMFIMPPPFIMPLFMSGMKKERQEFVVNTLSVGTLTGLAGYVVIILVFGL